MNKKIKKFFLTLLFCASIASSTAQSREADSLLNVLKALDANPSHEFLPAIKGSSADLGLDTIRINTLNSLAWELKNNKLDTSIILSDQALLLAQKNKWQKGEGKSYHQLGTFNSFKGNYLIALDYAFKAIKIRKSLNDKGGISATLGNIGNIYKEQGNYPKALDYYFNALKMSEELGNKKGIGGYLSNIGNVYAEQSDYPKALDCYFKVLKIAEALKDKSGIARIFGNIGNIYRGQGDYSKASDYYFKALKMNEDLRDKIGIAINFNNIGSVFYEQKNYTEALDYNFKALKITKEVGNKNGIARLLGNIGNLYTCTMNYKSAEEYLQKALALSIEINALRLVEQNQQYFSELYIRSNQPAKALNHYKKYIAVKDSIFNEENTKKAVRTEMNFEFEKKQAIAKAEQEKQNSIAKEEKQKQKIILILVSGFLLLVLVFASFMFNRWRITQQQKIIIEKQKEKIVSSITYAQLIQQSILMEETEIQKYLPDFFIYYQPKDIVSGDFYWCSKVNNLIILSAVDCTGHGVPGAFMSMIGNTLLNQIVNEKQITTPSEILRQLNMGVFEALHQKKEGALSHDGMDIAVCCIDYKNNQIEYAGAQNPLYILTNNQITVINADKQTIGGKGVSASKKKESSKTEYTNHIIPIKKGMSIYLFTDGYMDQFGLPAKALVKEEEPSSTQASVPKGKKFGIQQFKALLLNNQHLSMQQQKEIIATVHENWKGNTPQTDDVLVMGIRL